MAGLGIVVNLLLDAISVAGSEGVQGNASPNGGWVLACMAGGIFALVAASLVAARCRPRRVRDLILSLYQPAAAIALE